MATLASVDHTKLQLNYHWPTDAPDAVHRRTLDDAIAVCDPLLRDRAHESGQSDLTVDPAARAG